MSLQRIIRWFCQSRVGNIFFRMSIIGVTRIVKLDEDNTNELNLKSSKVRIRIKVTTGHRITEEVSK